MRKQIKHPTIYFSRIRASVLLFFTEKCQPCIHPSIESFLMFFFLVTNIRRLKQCQCLLLLRSFRARLSFSVSLLVVNRRNTHTRASRPIYEIYLLISLCQLCKKADLIFSGLERISLVNNSPTQISD